MTTIQRYPKVSIIILNWNGLEDTIECLESLKKITYPNYEVIVVDNGSQGDDARILREKFGDYIHLIQNDKNYGYTGGMNIGARHALNNLWPDYILFLNNDTVADPDFLNEMVKVAEGANATGIVGAAIYSYDHPSTVQHFIGGKIDWWRGQENPLKDILLDKITRRESGKEKRDQIEVVDWVTGCCSLVKGVVIKDIGLLDETLFIYCDDVDYCTRAKKAGYTILYAPRAKVWHKLSRSRRKVSGFHCYYSVRNRFYFMKKHATKWQYRCFLTYFFGFYFWLATAFYLIYHCSPKLLASFYRGVRDGMSEPKITS